VSDHVVPSEMTSTPWRTSPATEAAPVSDLPTTYKEAETLPDRPTTSSSVSSTAPVKTSSSSRVETVVMSSLILLLLLPGRS